MGSHNSVDHQLVVVECKEMQCIDAEALILAISPVVSEKSTNSGCANFSHTIVCQQ